MGCGKTTVGRLAANHLDIFFSDLDREIERRAHQTIVSLFGQDGEPAFREHEHQTLADIIQTHSIEDGLIALGGGTWIQPQNRHLISAERVIFMDVPYPVLEARILNSHGRPLVRDAKQLETLYRERLPFYRQAGVTVRIDSGDGLHAAATKVSEVITVLLRGSM